MCNLCVFVCGGVSRGLKGFIERERIGSNIRESKNPDNGKSTEQAE